MDVYSLNKNIITAASEGQANDVVSQIKTDLDAVYPYFSEKQKNAKRNLDWYAGRQWTDEEKEQIHSQGRNPYVFNEISHKVDHIIGIQTQTRTETQLAPREQEDNIAVEILQILLKWAEQINGLKEIESLVFFDGLVKAYGAVQIRWQTEDLIHGYPSVEKIPYNELYWDLTTSSKTPETAKWMARVVHMTKSAALELYPNAKEYIRSGVVASYGGAMHGRWNNPTHKQEVAGQYYSRYTNNEDRELIEVIEHYEKIKINKYIIIDDLRNEEVQYNSLAEGQAYYEGLIKSYVDSGKSIMSANGDMLVDFKVVMTTKVMQRVIINEELVSETVTSMPFFPYEVLHSYESDGDFWCFVDNLISPQMLVNRMFSQWDYAIGTSSKNAITVMEALLPRNYKIHDLEIEYSRTTPVIPVISHDAIRPMTPSAVNPQLFEAIMFGINRMTDYAGGRNALGLQENAAESGRAVMARAEAGGISKLPLFDRLRQWRERLSSKLVWWIKNYIDEDQIARILGEYSEIRYEKLPEHTIDSLAEIQYDVIVDEVNATDSIRERNFEQIKQFMQTTGQIPPEVALPILVEYSNLAEAQKTKILEQLESYQHYIQQKAQSQEQQKMQAEVERSLRKKQMKEEMQGGGEMPQSDEDRINDVVKGQYTPEEIMAAKGALNTPSEVQAGLLAQYR